jgi:intein/homing endonuclease
MDRDAWDNHLEYLGLDHHEARDLRGPFVRRTLRDVEEPHLFTLRVMRDPLYFYWTCKVLFGIELFPYQCVILAEMWCRPFPMLIGARGLGKCLDGSTYTVTSCGFRRLGDVVGDVPPLERKYEAGLSMLGESGYGPVEYSWNNGPGPTKRVLTRYGYGVEGTPNHPVRVVRDGEICWVNLEDVQVGDRVPIDRSERWFPETNDLSPENRSAIDFTTADPELLPALDAIWGIPFKRVSDTITYRITRVACWDSLFDDYGFVGTRSGDKDFPTSVLSASKEAVAAFIRGLFDTDGTAGKTCASVQYASKSSRLIQTLQFVLLRFGIVSRQRIKYNKKYSRNYYYLDIFGRDAKLFHERIGFGLKRKRDILASHLDTPENPNHDVLPAELVRDDLLGLSAEWRSVRPEASRAYNPERNLFRPHKLKHYEVAYATLEKMLGVAAPVSWCGEYGRLSEVLESNYFYDVVVAVEDGHATTYDVHMESDEDRSFVSNGLISHNSTLLSIYSLLRAIFRQGSRIVVCGSGFRQAKTILGYGEQIWYRSPMLRSLFADQSNSGPSHAPDRWTMRLGDSVITGMPIGDGGSIRGERANVILADEFAAQDESIFEEVIAGFGVVSLSPVDQAKARARKRVLRRKGLWSDEADEVERRRNLGNQIVFSGTASWEWNHFCRYWKKWRAIVFSRGDRDALRDALGSEPEDGFDWRDYSVIRVPYDALPEGYLEDKQVSRTKGTTHAGIFLNEYGACFSRDSLGFFKRSLIESCVANDPVTPNRPGAKPVRFVAAMRGRPGARHVIAVDPASDNFAIVVLECGDDHRRVVHCWTTDRARFRQRAKLKADTDTDYYRFCARKIRQLLRDFPADVICLDRGLGVAVEEALGSPDEGDRIVPVNPDHPLWDGESRTTDYQAGLHILEPVQFGRAEYVAEANHGMRLDMEDRVLLFPGRDGAGLAAQSLRDEFEGRTHDTLEQCVKEIEDLKDELTSIQLTRTAQSNRERWDTPETKQAGTRKGRQKKDRYSALLMANMAGRRLARAPEAPEYVPHGGFADRILQARSARPEPLYVNAPTWFKTAHEEATGDFGHLGFVGGDD